MESTEVVRLALVAVISVSIPEFIRFVFNRSTSNATIAQKTIGIQDVTMDNLFQMLEQQRKEIKEVRAHLSYLENWFRENDMPVPIYENRNKDVD